MYYGNFYKTTEYYFLNCNFSRANFEFIYLQI